MNCRNKGLRVKERQSLVNSQAFKQKEQPTVFEIENHCERNQWNEIINHFVGGVSHGTLVNVSHWLCLIVISVLKTKLEHKIYQIYELTNYEIHVLRSNLIVVHLVSSHGHVLFSMVLYFDIGPKSSEIGVHHGAEKSDDCQKEGE